MYFFDASLRPGGGVCRGEPTHCRAVFAGWCLMYAHCRAMCGLMWWVLPPPLLDQKGRSCPGARTHNLSLGRINVCDISFLYKKTLLNPSCRLPDVDTAQRIFEKFNFNDWTGEDDAEEEPTTERKMESVFLFQLLLRGIFVHDFRFESIFLSLFSILALELKVGAAKKWEQNFTRTLSRLFSKKMQNRTFFTDPLRNKKVIAKSIRRLEYFSELCSSENKRF